MECRHVHFCTDDYILILNGFSSCIFLYGWLPSHFERIVVMYISLRMTTISFWKDCRHLHFCTNDYHFFLNGLLSCTFLYGWLPSLFEWIFFMHISVRMTTISFFIGFRHTFSVQWLSIFFVYGFSSCIFCENDYQFLFE